MIWNVEKQKKNIKEFQDLVGVTASELYSLLCTRKGNSKLIFNKANNISRINTLECLKKILSSFFFICYSLVGVEKLECNILSVK